MEEKKKINLSRHRLMFRKKVKQDRYDLEFQNFSEKVTNLMFDVTFV